MQKLPKPVLVFTFILINVFWMQPSHAQPTKAAKTIVPGSEELLLDRIHPYSFKFELIMIQEGEELYRGILTDEVRLLEDKGIIERIQVVKRPNRPRHKDSVRASLKTLEPFSHSSINSRREIELSFDPLKVWGTYLPASSDPVEIKETFEHRYFDSNWVDFTIRLLPLELGYKAMLLTHEVSAKGDSGFVPYSVEVVRERRIKDAEEESVNVWVVRQTKGGRETLFYIKEKSRELLKMEIPISANQKMIIRRI